MVEVWNAHPRGLRRGKPWTHRRESRGRLTKVKDKSMKSMAALLILQHGNCVIQRYFICRFYRVNNWPQPTELQGSSKRMSQCGWTKTFKFHYEPEKSENRKKATAERREALVPLLCYQLKSNPPGDEPTGRERGGTSWCDPHSLAAKSARGWAGGAAEWRVEQQRGICSCKLRLMIHHRLHCSIHSSITAPFMPRHSFQNNQRREADPVDLLVGGSSSKETSFTDIFMLFIDLFIEFFFNLYICFAPAAEFPPPEWSLDMWIQSVEYCKIKCWKLLQVCWDTFLMSASTQHTLKT